MKIDTPQDIAERVADWIGVYGEDRCDFVAGLTTEIRESVHNEDKLTRVGINP